MNRNTTKVGALAAVGAAMVVLVLSTGTARLAAANSPARSGAAAQNSSGIRGKVLFAGTAPKRAALDMSGDAVCAGEHSEPVLAADGAVNANGTLPNAFLYIENVPGNFPVPAPTEVDQTGCMYQPHVFGVMVGQELRIVSTDPTTHNVHFMSKLNKPWNQTQEPGAPPLVRKFTRPEIMVMVHCNRHPWMSAYAGITSNPFFAVTRDDGTFTIKGLPPGKYTLHAWTATFGSQEQEVVVQSGETATANFTFK